MAELIVRTVKVDVLSVGGICDLPSDEQRPAVSTESGTIGYNHFAYTYVVQGDRVPASPGLGIGLRVALEIARPGNSLTFRIGYPDGYTSEWEASVDPSGSVEFASFPDRGTLREGQYVFSAHKGEQRLFLYAITVEGQDNPGPCVLPTS